ncbi:MAG: hypothetical protein HYR55_14200 [Acidobacteria bacterium]|nr:hypothetical protein [Acidobacteriota bacterium]MBI3658770.1 hypothetical protein [Acidobacteriota bacterium]
MKRMRALSIASMMMVAVGFLVFTIGSPALLAHDDHGQPRYDAYQQGEQVGHEYGYNHGLEDRRAGEGFDFQSREYRRAIAGYDLRFGSLLQYRRGFQSGYEAGYNEGYYSRRGGRRQGWRRWRRMEE